MCFPRTLPSKSENKVKSGATSSFTPFKHFAVLIFTNLRTTERYQVDSFCFEPKMGQEVRNVQVQIRLLHYLNNGVTELRLLGIHEGLNFNFG